MNQIKKFFKQDKFAEHVGIELLDVSEGYARAALEIKPHHLNAVGILHGAALFSLADLAFAVATPSRPADFAPRPAATWVGVGAPALVVDDYTRRVRGGATDLGAFAAVTPP